MSPDRKNEDLAEAQPLSLRSRILRGVFLAVLFSLPVVLIYQIALPVAGFFGDEFPELLRDKCIRMILVVACFIASAVACNFDRFSDNRIGRFTAVFACFFLVHISFSVWAAPYPNLAHRFGRGAPMLQYLWMLGSFLYGILTWWIIRRRERRRHGLPAKVAKSQFTIGSILAWISFTGLMIAVLKSWAFRVLLDSGLDPNASIDVVVCAIACALLVLPLTLLLMRTRRLLLVALGCWILCFAASWLLFALVGLSDSEYDWRDGYVSTIFAFSLASAAFLFWIQVLRIVLNVQVAAKENEINRPRLVRRLATGAFAIATIVLWCFLGFWVIGNLATFSKERSFAAFDSSPLIMQQLEDAYGIEAITRVREAHDPKRVHEWLNHLSRDRVPKERDFNYQIAKLSRQEFIDRPEGEGLYRELMGFSAKEVALLPDETIETWVKKNRIEPENEEYVSYEDDVADYLANMSNDTFGWQLPYAPWDQTVMPLAAKFCREKQTLIQRIRSLIRSCEEGTYPQFEHGFFTNDAIPRFAADMLLVDSRYAIDLNDLPRLFDNLECISKLAKMRYPSNSWSYLSQRFRARAMELLIHLAEVKQLGESEVSQIRELATGLNSPIYESEINKARRFGSLMLEHRSNMDSRIGENYLLLDRKLESRLIAAFPQTVHWPDYIKACKERYDYNFSLRKEIQSNPSRIAEIYELATTETDLEQPFHRHVLDLLETPWSRSDRLGASNFEFELISTRLLIVFGIRAKLRNVALKLLLYRVANGDFPQSLRELDCSVDDPFSNQDFIYRIDGDRFELYSVGADGVDDNGEQQYDADDFSFVWPARTLAEYFENN